MMDQAVPRPAATKNARLSNADAVLLPLLMYSANMTAAAAAARG
jgi:hypothetical protein